MEMQESKALLVLFIKHVDPFGDFGAYVNSLPSPCKINLRDIFTFASQSGNTPLLKHKNICSSKLTSEKLRIVSMIVLILVDIHCSKTEFNVNLVQNLNIVLIMLSGNWIFIL